VFHRLPSPEESAYLPRLTEIVQSEGVDVIVPQTTREVEVLSNQKNRFSDLGVGVVASEADAVTTANDKFLILEECRRLGMPTPEYLLCNSKGALTTALEKLGYPERSVVVKPRRSSGMRGLRVLTEDSISVEQLLLEKPSGLRMRRDDFLAIFPQDSIPEFLATEFLPGEEYTVDLFRNESGCLTVPRRRRAVRSGISFDTRVDMREDIISMAASLAESIKLRYCFGFQYKLDAEGIPKILEGNPRVQGTMVTVWFAGFNMIYAAIREAMGEPVDLKGVEIKDGTEFLRYWGGVGILGDDLVTKI
jgi:carbamoyl-phosphate synthase large subunit